MVKNSLFSRLSNIILMLVLFATPPAALPCRCGKVSFKTYYKIVDVVVVGKVSKIEPNLDSGGNIAHLSVSEVWKKDAPAEILIIYGRTNCSYKFEEGQEYLLYLKDYKDAY